MALGNKLGNKLPEDFKLAKTLEDKLDVAYEIYLEASALAASLPDADVDKKHVMHLRDRAADFMKIMLNVSSDEEMKTLAEKRKKMKEFKTDFLPRGEEAVVIGDAESRVQYNWKRLAKLAVALKRREIMRVEDRSRELDKVKKTIFLTHEERAKHRIILKSGLFYKPLQGVELVQDQFELCDTTSMISHEKLGYAAYVINAQGEISIFAHHGMADHYAHSSMNAGASVLGAGELKIEKGVLKQITTHSGHYQPSIENVYRVLKFLQQQGVNIDEVQIRAWEERGDIHYVINDTDIRPPRVYYKGTDIIKWGDSAEEKKKKEALERKNKRVHGWIEKMKSSVSKEGGLDDVQLILKKLCGEVDGLKKQLEEREKLLSKKESLVVNLLKSFWYRLSGKGSYGLMKTKRIDYLHEVKDNLADLIGEIEKNIKQLDDALRGTIETGDLKKHLDGEAMQLLSTKHTEIKKKLEGSEEDMRTKYGRGIDILLPEQKKKLHEIAEVITSASKAIIKPEGAIKAGDKVTTEASKAVSEPEEEESSLARPGL